MVLLVFLFGCGSDFEKNRPPSYQLTAYDGYLEAYDSAGRALALIPKGSKEAPKGFKSTRVIEVPVQRVVVASGGYDPGILLALGKLETMVGNDDILEDWHLPEVIEAYKSGAVQFIGLWNALDMEIIRGLKPDIVLSSNMEIAANMESLGFPVAVTYNNLDNDLANRLRLFEFIGALVGREQKARELVEELESTLTSIKEAVKPLHRPKISWGIYYNNRIFPLYGDFWLSEIFENCGADYAFQALRFGSMEIDIEKFIIASTDAEI
ncbi:MAG: ABC transporter substrate-binding protein, partial [Deltaproteobacteria bacterium]|nr:ABC transporter substrate-binding protein [Deltaproteobacteria bacterium]